MRPLQYTSSLDEFQPEQGASISPPSYDQN